MSEYDLEIIKTIAISGTAIVAIFTLIKGYIDYKNINKLKRIEIYESYSKKIREDKILMEIINCLEENDEQLKNIPRINRYFFLRFYEDIALALNSKLMRPKIVHYMFAYYALQCYNSENFWDDIEKGSSYWRVFNEFIEKMRKLENKNSNKIKLKFKI
jgi:hypothetical protein